MFTIAPSSRKMPARMTTFRGLRIPRRCFTQPAYLSCRETAGGQAYLGWHGQWLGIARAVRLGNHQPLARVSSKQLTHATLRSGHPPHREEQHAWDERERGL
jgi:hypothetical protein